MHSTMVSTADCVMWRHLVHTAPLGGKVDPTSTILVARLGPFHQTSISETIGPEPEGLKGTETSA